MLNGQILHDYNPGDISWKYTLLGISGGSLITNYLGRYWVMHEISHKNVAKFWDLIVLDTELKYIESPNHSDCQNFGLINLWFEFSEIRIPWALRSYQLFLCAHRKWIYLMITAYRIKSLKYVKSCSQCPTLTSLLILDRSNTVDSRVFNWPKLKHQDNT